MRKYTNSKLVSQLESQIKRSKGEIIRTNRHIVSNRNAYLPTATREEREQEARHLEFYLSRCSNRKLRLISYLIKLSAVDGEISRAYIAERFGYSERTVTAIIVELEAYGWFDVTQRYKKINQFHPSAKTRDPIIRDRLMEFLPVMKYILCLSMLLVGTIQSETSRLKKERGVEQNSFEEMGERVLSFEPLFGWSVRREDPQQREGRSKCNNAAVVAANKARLDEIFSSKKLLKRRDMELKSFVLTQAGEINLLPFPTSAIEHADEITARKLATTKLKEPFGYFLKQAKDWCAERNIRPDWRPMYDGYDAHGIGMNDSRVESVLIESKKTPKLPVVEQWKATKSNYEIEQEEVLTFEERCERIRPGIESLLKLSSTTQDYMISLIPFDDRDAIIAYLKSTSTPTEPINNKVESPVSDNERAWHDMDEETQLATWRPLARDLSKLTAEQRFNMLVKRDMDYAYQALEKAIAELTF